MTNLRHRHRTRSRRRAFTLVELMVTLVAASLVISSIYFISAASARHFHEQQRISQTQMSLRMAMEQLRRDIQRAGFLGTPNSAVDQVCQAPPARVAALDTYVNDDEDATGWLPNAAENRVSADRLIMAGNYVTGDAYLAIGLDADGDTIFLQRTWQSFRRTFGEPFQAGAFTDVFQVGRGIHIRTLQGNNFFAVVTGTNAATASITFAPAMGVGGMCVVGLADGALVSPFNRVEYTVSDLTRAGADAENLESVEGAVGEDDFLGRTNAMLIRREVRYNSNAIVAGTTRPVLEYVADFNLQFIVDDQATAGLPPILRRLTEVESENYILLRPHRARSVIVSLSARTAEQDPRFGWVQRAVGQPLTRYRVNPELAGAARVRTMRQEIVLPNVAGRVIRP